MKKKRRIYMDYAAATPVDPRVAKIMRKYESQDFGNPSSIHAPGITARRAVEEARKKVADVLACRPSEIIFTSGGTEGDNLAIFGAARSRGVPFPLTTGKGDSFQKQLPVSGHIITSAIEHNAVLAPCRALEEEARGFDVTYLPVSPDGFVNPDDVKKALRPDTFLVSIMYANNEVGTVQPISEIAKVIRGHRQKLVFSAHGRKGDSLQNPISDSWLPLFHTDACQAPGALPLNVAKLGVDLMTLSGAKIYGPKGAGVLYVRSGVAISPIICGGGQESDLRSGTENVPGIVGLAEALSMVETNRQKESERLAKLRDYFADNILKTIPGSAVNGYLGAKLPNGRLANNLNIFIPNIDNEQLVIELDAIGIACSRGSACDSNQATGSHVIFALHHSPERNRGSVRFSLGRSTTKKDIDYVLKNLPEILKRISELCEA